MPQILSQVEAYPDGLNGFTIKLYDEILGRKTRFVDPKWEIADDGRLLIQYRKSKYEFWTDDDDS